MSGKGETEVEIKRCGAGGKKWQVTVGCCKANRQSREHRENNWEPCICSCLWVTMVNRLGRQVEETLYINARNQN